MVPVISFFNIFVFPGLLFLFCLALFTEWIDRKVVARLQNRVGPCYSGPWGILQPLADFIKLLSKEDISPIAADKPFFSIIPIFILSLSLTPLFLIPFTDTQAIVSFEGDLIFIIFINTIITLLIFLAAWSSTNRLSTVGGMRVALQMLGYEIPLTIAMIGPAISAQSLSISKIIEIQTTKPLFLLTQPIGFIIVITCLLAELHWTPFDIPDAESEIVAGWFVEFSGKKLALLRLAKDFELVLAASLMTSLYLGGPLGPWQQNHFLYFLAKFIFSILILSNIRALFARLTIDKVLQGTWKYLTPLALLQIALVQFMPW